MIVTLVLCTNIEKENWFSKGKGGTGEGKTIKQGNWEKVRKQLNWLASYIIYHAVICIMTKLPLVCRSR